MDALKRIRAAEADGRASNGRYVQKQLTALHNALTQNASALQEAMRTDSHNTAAEIEVEYHLAVDCVKRVFAQIDFAKEVKEEYAVARGEDAPLRRVGAGTVYIAPATGHTLLYGVISPLSAAIAAGNCVVVELGTTVQELPRVLGSLLRKALDSDTVAVIGAAPKEVDAVKGFVHVLGGSNEAINPTATSLVSPAEARVIAVVDRTASIEAAAEHVVRARAGFGGRSPYGPDLVLVNEFKLKEFTDAAVSKFAKYLSASSNGTTNVSASGYHKRKIEEVISKEEREEQGTTVVVTGDNGTIVTVGERNSKLLTKKVATPLLIIHPITSLDDAIDFANSGSSPLLAAYTFGSPAAVKYLSQFLNANISYANTISTELLVGPAAPLHHNPTAHPRYCTEMFQVTRPQHAKPSVTSEKLRKTLDGADGVLARELRAETLTKLPKDGQAVGHAIGFFEQGALLGLTLYVIPVLGGLGALGYYGVKAGLRRWR